MTITTMLGGATLARERGQGIDKAVTILSSRELRDRPVGDFDSQRPQRALGCGCIPQRQDIGLLEERLVRCRVGPHVHAVKGHNRAEQRQRHRSRNARASRIAQYVAPAEPSRDGLHQENPKGHRCGLQVHRSREAESFQHRSSQQQIHHAGIDMEAIQLIDLRIDEQCAQGCNGKRSAEGHDEPGRRSQQCENEHNGQEDCGKNREVRHEHGGAKQQRGRSLIEVGDAEVSGRNQELEGDRTQQ